jgi:predicted transcriptional regulator YdeE
METYTFQNDLKVFGKQVKTFPNGIKEAFDELIEKIPGGLERSHYGLSYMTTDGKIVYFAATREEYEGEAEKYNYERYTIEKGEYLAVTIKDWMNNLHCIKDVFHEMMQDKRADVTKKVVEWYKDDKEMMCLVKMINGN